MTSSVSNLKETVVYLINRRIGRTCLALTFALLASIPPVMAQDTKGVSAKEIRVGIMSALSGPVAAYGVAMQAGTSSYFSMLNEKGGINGRKIQLVGDDSQMSTPVALAAARKMTSGDGIFALVNSGGTPQVEALRAYLIEQNNVPVFGSYGGLLDWYNPPKKGLYGVPVVGEDQARALGRWAAKDGRKKVVVLHIEAATFTKAAKEVETGFRSATSTGSVELIGLKLPTTDYAPVVVRLSQIKPDALVVMNQENETILLANELQNQNLKIPMYAWTPSVSMKVIELGGTAVEGMKAVSWTIAPTDDTPAVREYRAALAKYHPNDKPDFVSLYTWGATKIFAEALSRLKGRITADELQKAFYSLRNFETGIVPPVTYSAERHLGTNSVFPAEVVNGKWKMGKPIDTDNLKW